jgi:hypothetical protein
MHELDGRTDERLTLAHELIYETFLHVAQVPTSTRASFLAHLALLSKVMTPDNRPPVSVPLYDDSLRACLEIPYAAGDSLSSAICLNGHIYQTDAFRAGCPECGDYDFSSGVEAPEPQIKYVGRVGKWWESKFEGGGCGERGKGGGRGER